MNYINIEKMDADMEELLFQVESMSIDDLLCCEKFDDFQSLDLVEMRNNIYTYLIQKQLSFHIADHLSKNISIYHTHNPNIPKNQKKEFLFNKIVELISLNNFSVSDNATLIEVACELI